VAHQKTWPGEAGVDWERSPLQWDEFDQQLLLATDAFRQQQIDQENQAFLAGIAILSRNPQWTAVQAELCSQNAAELEKPFPASIDEIRARAFEMFEKKADALLRTVSDPNTADAYCGVLSVVSRAAFWDCRLGQPPQYCPALSADAQSFERKVALHMERAKKKAYQQASQATINVDRSRMTGGSQLQHLSLDPSVVLGKADCLLLDILHQTDGAVQPADTEAIPRDGSKEAKAPEATGRSSADEEPRQDPSPMGRPGRAPVGSREDRLQAFLQQHPGATLADIKYSANVHTPEFQDWRQGRLKTDSVMSRRIEDVLTGKTPLKKKPGKRRGD
jgi:hypothetical protein